MDKIKRACALLMILSGFAIAMYPFFSNLLYNRNASKVIEEYEEEITNLEREEIDAIKEAAKQYNSQLQAAVFKDESGQWRGEGTSYLDMLDVGSALGYITIPKIDVNLPIYYGTSADALSKGVGYIEQTSFPLGGEGTHSVLTGHRGLPNAALFTDLDKMERGDKFYLHVLDETLAYQVDQIRVVEPDDTSNLKVIGGKDYCSLVTCTPYAINSHRLILRGIRVPYTGEEEVESAEDGYRGFSTGMVVKRVIDVWPILLAAVIFVIGVEFVMMLFLLKRIAAKQKQGAGAKDRKEKDRKEKRKARQRKQKGNKGNEK
ncbi:MAG: class C sortase [Muribaculaceae bacterium]|nr:class C sortase [Muribaculaceae bacterium]